MGCRRVQPLLSEYIDNTLSAHATFAVDRHLAACHECTRLINELRRTVQLLSGAPRFEVSPDFVANLQSRIQRLEPKPVRRLWWTGFSELLRPRFRAAWGAAIATVALAVAVIPRLTGTDASVEPGRPPSARAMVSTAARQSAALAITDPFGDLAAANLAAHASERGE